MELTLKSYKEFWEQLPVNVEANLKFAKYIITGDSVHQYYFWGEYSKPILSWIIVNALYRSYTPQAEREITGRYYEFVAGPFKDCLPQWHQLVWYKGINNEKLHSWLKRNGCQWFRKDKIKDEKEHSLLSELIEFKEYNTLNDVKDEDSPSDEQLLKEQRLLAAWNNISDKDREIIKSMVLEDLHWSKAWDTLNKYIKPREGVDVMQTWSPKLKQDSLARLKARAIKHLILRYNMLL